MTEKKNRYLLSGILLVIAVLSIYSNTLNSPWIMDDFHNIVKNPKIQIKSLTFESVKGSLFSYISVDEKLYRPVACFTFAINALLGGENPFGYHVVNITIHVFTSLLLIWLLIMVFRTPALEKTPEHERHFIIILSAFLWAVHPIQIQAVTYIVQRMTSLCAMFSIISLTFYIKARLSESGKTRFSYSIFCIISIILSTFSKENGLITIPLIMLIEYFLFKNGDYKNFSKKTLIVTIVVFMILGTGLVLYILGFSGLKEVSGIRPFTMYQRLLTQPGVILYYLSLIFYPLPDRFSFEHEFAISTGFFSPPQTFLYITIIIFAFIASIFIKKTPVLARLSIAFFLVAHSVESSIIPLEMVFEHRNYLPSIFVFLPISAGLYRILDNYKSQKKYMLVVIAFFVTAIIFLTGISTYNRNFDWQTAEKFWTNAMENAPSHTRPKHALGVAIGMKNPEKALEYYFGALKGYMHEPLDNKYSTLSNIGFIYLDMKDYKKAVPFFQEAIALNKKIENPYVGLAKAYMYNKEWNKAIQTLTNVPAHPNLMALKSVCYLYTGEYQKALAMLRELIGINYENKKTLLNIAEAFSMAGNYERADLFYRIYLSKFSTDINVLLGMAKNSYLKGNFQKSSEYLKVFFKKAGVEKSPSYIKELNGNIVIPLIGLEKMKDFIENEFENYKQAITITNNIVLEKDQGIIFD